MHNFNYLTSFVVEIYSEYLELLLIIRFCSTLAPTYKLQG